METFLQEARDKARDTTATRSHKLICDETAVVETMPAQLCKSKHPSVVHCETVPTKPPSKTVFDVVDASVLHELQWAIITYLAIDSTFREAVAQVTPPRPAAYLRNLEMTYSTWLLGSTSTSAITTLEAVLEFVNTVEILYKTPALGAV
jgi:hypothetical protein